jgi:hypothetical protein
MCEANIDVEEDELDEGEDLSCDECGATLHVAGLSPLELEAEGDDDEDEEGWDDDDDDDDDDEDEDEDEDDEDW